MLRGLLGSRHAGSTPSLSALDEPKALEDAMYAASFMINDDMDTAEVELAKGNSAFHKLGKGVVTFLRATLGFEREVMKEAQARLADAESTASDHMYKAQKNPSTSASNIYTAGQEYALCLAEVRIMGAVVGVLTESVTESIKGFYKLRQAYITLDAVLQEEKKYLTSIGHGSGTASTVQSSTTSLQETPQSSSNVGDSEDEFFDAADDATGATTTPKYLGRLSTDADVAEDVDKLTIKDEKPAKLRRLSSAWEEGPGMDVFGDNPIDGFIHSGSNMCFGIILIMISLIPPAFNTLVRIVGFKGDRPRGLAMLWQASKFDNINGAFAGLVLLGYYNGFTGFCDILPQHGTGVYPVKRCTALLETFRARYPKSRLWILEEARMLSSARKPEEAVELLRNTEDSQLRQVLALQWFERSLNNMYFHSYEECSVGFQKCVSLNNWSHGLYYYIAGACHVELYRELKGNDAPLALEHAKKAEQLLRKVPEHIGKKKMMGRQLPFDTFVGRKIQKWEQRSKDWKVDFIDAIGVSPIEEMTYFWNGYKRMRPEHLERCLHKLAWSTSEANPHWSKENLDEQALLAVLQGTVLRNLGRTKEAREVLQSKVLSHPWAEFKGGYKDNWTCPVATYETAVSYWNDYCESSEQSDLKESSKWLDKVAAWEAYDLDARIGMRVKTGAETIKKEIEDTS
ncbi:hypothetical protein Vi05172_g13219 [Venturia inaequalis]|nr:hypothetical protein Vi05172_g13219 [Venturia inaequalis]